MTDWAISCHLPHANCPLQGYHHHQQQFVVKPAQGASGRFVTGVRGLKAAAEAAFTLAHELTLGTQQGAQGVDAAAHAVSVGAGILAGGLRLWQW